MKPKLNKIVYTIYRTSITKSTVAYVGSDSFIIEHLIKVMIMDMSIITIVIKLLGLLLLIKQRKKFLKV